MTPFYSIIVVSMNAELTIRKTLDSILEQDFKDYEIVVKDGISTDKTLDNIPISKKIEVIISSDNGIYDAMNQGISNSSGKFLFFLNCGDIFYSNTILGDVHAYLENSHDEYCILYSDYLRNGITFQMPIKLSEFYLFRTPLNHQTMFFNRILLCDYNGYNLNYQILSDYEFTLRAFFNNVSFKHLDITTVDYLGGGVSESKKGITIKREEYKRLRKANYSRGKRFLYTCILLLSFKKFRELIVSDSSPYILRLIYRKIVNGINRKR